MRWILSVAMLCAVAGPVMGSAAAANPRPPPLTKLEIRRASQDEVRRRVFEHLSEALILPDQSRSKRPVRPLEDLWLWTRAYGTATPGLCRSDLLEVRFVPVGPEQGAATPVRAAGLETSAFYHFLREVHPDEAGTLDHSGRVSANVECAAIDRMNTGFIHVISEYDTFAEPLVVSAIWRLRYAVRAAAQQGKLPYRLQCIEDLENRPDECRKALSEINPDSDVSGISKCDPDDLKARLSECWSYGLHIYGRSVEIIGGGAGNAEPVSLVQVRQTVEIFGERVD